MLVCVFGIVFAFRLDKSCLDYILLKSVIYGLKYLKRFLLLVCFDGYIKCLKIVIFYECLAITRVPSYL